MITTGRAVVWRLLPPFRKSLTVNRITVGGFLALVEAVARRVVAVREKLGRDLTEKDVIESLGEAEVNLFADVVCAGQPRGFFSRWMGGYLMTPLTGRNLRALLKASVQAEGPGGWTRIMASISRPERKEKGDRGGVMADVLTLAGMLNLDPLEIRDSWTMQDYIILCESLNLMSKTDDAVKAASGDVLGMIPGIGVVN